MMKNQYDFNQIPGDMERIQRVLNHPEFKKSIKEIHSLEKERTFCRHGMEHLLDVARIAYIINLEQNAGIAKDVIYAAGLLHDVGKYLQYIDGTPHHISSAQIGRNILEDAGYDQKECEAICQAILTHRDGEASKGQTLGRILYQADKLSRACYACQASDECNWSEEKKTPGVIS